MVPTYSTTCNICDTTTETDVVPGKLTFRKNIFKQKNNIGELHQEYYLPSIERLVYHRSYYKIIGKNNVAYIRHNVFKSSTGSIATHSDYAEIFSFSPDRQLQGEYFSNNRSLSMKGCRLDHLTTTLQLYKYATARCCICFEIRGRAMCISFTSF